MSLAPWAICSTEEVWAYLEATEDERNLLETQMETWVNGASFILERLLNRPIKARQFDVYQNGSGRRTLMAEYYPIIAMHTIEVSTADLLSTYSINPLRSAKEVVIDLNDGKMTLLPSAQVGRWLEGVENIHLVYEAGFTGYHLDAFKAAVKELIASPWMEMGKDPRIQQLSESTGSATFAGKFDPRRLTYQTQLAIYAFRRIEF